MCVGVYMSWAEQKKTRLRAGAQGNSLHGSLSLHAANTLLQYNACQSAGRHPTEHLTRWTTNNHGAVEQHLQQLCYGWCRAGTLRLYSRQGVALAGLKHCTAQGSNPTPTADKCFPNIRTDGVTQRGENRKNGTAHRASPTAGRSTQRLKPTRRVRPAAVQLYFMQPSPHQTDHLLLGTTKSCDLPLLVHS
jgi:hypothetical protein